MISGSSWTTLQCAKKTKNKQRGRGEVCESEEGVLNTSQLCNLR